MIVSSFYDKNLCWLVCVYYSCICLSVQLHFLRLPRDISKCYVILMDATVATGAAAIMAIRVLLVSLHVYQTINAMSFPPLSISSLRTMMYPRIIFCLSQ